MQETDVELDDLTEIIHTFPLTADFVNWLSDGSFKQHLLYDEVENGKYLRILRFTIDGRHIFFGAGEFNLGKLNQNAAQALVSQLKPYHSTQPAFSRLEKKITSGHIDEFHYTMTTDLYFDKILCGKSWETFDVPNILYFYQNKKDPLAYWKLNRRI